MIPMADERKLNGSPSLNKIYYFFFITMKRHLVNDFQWKYFIVHLMNPTCIVLQEYDTSFLLTKKYVEIHGKKIILGFLR